MTTGWLLLLLIVSSQSVDSQSTTDDETCGEGGLLSRILDNQQQIFQILQRHQTILNRLGKSLFVLYCCGIPHLLLDDVACWYIRRIDVRPSEVILC